MYCNLRYKADEEDMNDPEGAAICPVCGSSKGSVFVQRLRQPYSWWHCLGCDLRFCWPMEPGDSDFYQSFWYYTMESHADSRRRLSSIAGRWDYRAVLDLRLAPGGRLLDIGCGNGEFMHLARERLGYDVTGIDFSHEAVHLAKTIYGLDSVSCAIWPDAATSMRPGDFDLVTIFHMVEHVAEPVGLIQSAASTLKDGGYLAVAMPCAKRRPALFCPSCDAPPNHLTLWSEDAVERAFQRANLEPIALLRSPLEPADFLKVLQDKYPLIRRPLFRRPLWIAGGRLMKLPVRIFGKVYPTVGSTVVGIGRKRSD